ncbi:MAG: hypothetical protein RIR83_235 [Pseudomonadota bacterium]|jgi:hypothetical protein
MGLSEIAQLISSDRLYLLRGYFSTWNDCGTLAANGASTFFQDPGDVL